MNVYFSGNYGRGYQSEAAGMEISINKEFLWGGHKWYVPAVYSCTEGLIIDFCMEIPTAKMDAYVKLKTQTGKISDLSEEELEQLEQENPYANNIEVIAAINGKKLQTHRMCSVGWHPDEGEESEDVRLELMEHYGCDRSLGWKFIRASFPWETAEVPEVTTLSLTLKEHPVPCSVIHFTTEEQGDWQQITCIHPISMQEYTITIHECTAQVLPEKSFEFNRELHFPTCYQMLKYSISPEIRPEEFMIRDCAGGDKPRNIITSSTSKDISSCGVLAIGGAHAPTAIFTPEEASEKYKTEVTCSALHFEPVPKVEWRVIFYVMEREDYSMVLSL